YQSVNIYKNNLLQYTGQVYLHNLIFSFLRLGTELTFNYNLDCRGNERIECKCGSANCSGFIGDRVKNDDAKNKRIVNGGGGGGGGPKQKKGKQRKSKQSFPSSSKSSSHEDACFKCGEM